MAHNFKIKKDTKGEYRAYFCYNRETIWWTEGYSSKSGAMNAIDSIKQNGPGAPVEDHTLVTSLVDERDKRTQPDPEFICRDQRGRKMFMFSFGYEHNGSDWTINVWAYDFDDAEARVTAMKETLTVLGQIYEELI